MKRLVYKDGYMEELLPIDSLTAKLYERIGAFNSNAKVYLHETLGVLVVPDDQIKIINRSLDYFNTFDSFKDLCKHEETIHAKRQADRSTLQRGVRTECNTIYNMYLLKNRNDVWKGLKPTTSDRYVGIELEMCSPESESTFIRTFKKHPLFKFASLAEDGSIEPEHNGEYGVCDCGAYDDGHEECYDECASMQQITELGIEVRVLCKESELNHVCKLIDDFKMEVNAYVNDSCGMHVHLDMRTRDVRDAYTNLFDNIDTIVGMCDSSRLESTYCKLNTRPTFDEQLDKSDRYYAINVESYSKHSTLEVRLHEGCLEGNKIKEYINSLIYIVDQGKQLELVEPVAV